MKSSGVRQTVSTLFSGPEEVIFQSLCYCCALLMSFVPQGLDISKSIAFHLLFGAGVMTELLAGQPRNRGSIPSRTKRLLQCPDRLWGHPASYLMGSRDSFPGGKAAWA
jgi:hypothetical protein